MNNRGIAPLIIVLILAGVVILGGGSIFYYQSQIKKGNIPVSDRTEQPASSSLPVTEEPGEQPTSSTLPAKGKTTEAKQGLQIVLKDYVGFPEVKDLQPTIKEIKLQKEGGSWTTIWSNPEGKAVKLTSDGAELVLDTVIVEAGTYVATKLLVSTIDVHADINRDGDTLDKNMEIILTEAEFNSLPPKDRPSAPSQPSAPSGGGGGGDKPSQPSAPSAPTPPYRIVDGIVYTGQYWDETHSVTLNDYIVPLFGSKFVYGGTGGEIIYDFTLHPLVQKSQQISIEVSQR